MQIPLYNIGSFIQQMRLSNNLSINLLSKKSGVNWNTIERIEQGESSPTFHTVQRIIEAMTLKTGPEEIILDSLINK